MYSDYLRAVRMQRCKDTRVNCVYFGTDHVSPSLHTVILSPDGTASPTSYLIEPTDLYAITESMIRLTIHH
jgi:hypothetical protein